MNPLSLYRIQLGQPEEVQQQKGGQDAVPKRQTVEDILVRKADACSE